MHNLFHWVNFPTANTGLHKSLSHVIKIPIYLTRNKDVSLLLKVQMLITVSDLSSTTVIPETSALCQRKGRALPSCDHVTMFYPLWARLTPPPGLTLLLLADQPFKACWTLPPGWDPPWAGGPPRQWQRHVLDSIRPSRLTTALGQIIKCLCTDTWQFCFLHHLNWKHHFSDVLPALSITISGTRFHSTMPLDQSSWTNPWKFRSMYKLILSWVEEQRYTLVQDIWTISWNERPYFISWKRFWTSNSKFHLASANTHQKSNSCTTIGSDVLSTHHQRSKKRLGWNMALWSEQVTGNHNTTTVKKWK